MKRFKMMTWAAAVALFVGLVTFGPALAADNYKGFERGDALITAAELKKAKTITAPLSRLVAEKGLLPKKTVAKVDTARQHTSKADALMRDLADKLKDSYHRGLREPVIGIADSHITPARQSLENVKLSDDWRDRIKHAKSADGHVDDAIAAINKLLEEDIEKLVHLIRTYFKFNGHHIQFNVVDTQTLRQAQASPDEYRNLLVRVAGYSDYFVDLDEDHQQEIIDRTEQALF